MRHFHADGRELVGLGGVVGVLLHRGRQLFHGGGGLLQRGGLFFRAAGQVGVAGGDLGRADVDLVHALAHRGNGAGQALLHALERREQGADFIVGTGFHPTGQVAARDAVEVHAGFPQRQQRTPRRMKAQHNAASSRAVDSRAMAEIRAEA